MARGRWRTCAAGIGIAALAGHVAAARADDLAPTAKPSGAISTLDLTPSARDVASDVEFPGVDFTPTGATVSAKAPRALAPGDVTPLDLSPNGSGDGALASLPLPPDAGTPVVVPDSTRATAFTPAVVAAPPTAVAPRPAETVAAPAPIAPPPDGLPAAVAEQPLGNPAAPLQAALAAYVAEAARARTQLDARPMRESLRAFYASRLDVPVWTDSRGLTAKGRSLLARLARADEDGLNVSASRLPGAIFPDASPARIATMEVALSAAAASYALQATGARVIPYTISSQVTARPEVVDPAHSLAALAEANDPGEALAAFNPPQRGYRELRDELATLRESEPSARALPGPVLRLGMSDPRVELVRARFGLGAKSESAEIYDARVASAVAAFQRVHGLAPDGALTPATTDALFGAARANTGRETAVIANMEMWRWQPREMGQRRVEINVPEYTLRVLDGEDEIQRERVIVGKPDTPTPIFSNDIRYILVNPIWRVPDSIIKKEMAPKLASDPNYLTRHGFKVTKVGDRLVVEQPPGEGNALGHILFMFPNEHAVYLHDTPARGLFDTSRRAYSHGCVRVEDPNRLAELFMGGAARGWTAARVQSLVGANEKTVFLPKPIPIHIEYFTEYVDESGIPREVEDVYGLTARVAATLSQFRQY